MTVDQADQMVKKRKKYLYAMSGVSILLTGLVAVALLYFWDEIQGAAGYGYAGCFVVSIMAGITLLPAPALPVVFTLGHKLSPVYIGLVAGFGEALGGITTYLTGMGGGTIWLKFRGKEMGVRQPLSEDGATPLLPHKLQSRQRAFFARITAPMQRRGGFWVVFIASAMVFSPFYLVALGAGALHMGLRKFFLISLAGKIVKGLYVAFAGYWGLSYLLGG